MSGLEIYGAIAATTSLIKVFRNLRDYTKQSSSARELLDQALRSSISQHANLESSLKAIKTNLEKYDRDVKQTFKPRDKEAISGIVDEIEKIGRRCKSAITQLKAAVQKNPINRHELETLQDEFAAAVAAIQTQQQTFATQIAMESYRQLSESVPFCVSRRPIDRSDSRTIASVESESITLDGHDTGISTATTLTPIPSNRSGSGSTDSGSSPKFIKSERLQSLIRDGEQRPVARLIETEGSESDSIKATALLLACRYKKTSIVRYLLLNDASLRIIDGSGLGVVHRTIGTSPQLSSSPEILEKKILEILELLAEKNASMSMTDRSPYQRTPLHYCVITGNYEAAKYVLRRNPNAVDKIDRERKTALYHACEDNSPKAQLIKLLLDKGASFAARSRPKIGSLEQSKTINRLLDKAESINGQLTKR